MTLVNDEYGEPTEQPTSLRLDEARRRGQVPQSAELLSAALLGGGVLALWLLGGGLMAALEDMCRQLLHCPQRTPSPTSSRAWRQGCSSRRTTSTAEP